MKTKIYLILVSLIISSLSNAQQIGDGRATEISDFSVPLKSGVYQGSLPLGMNPDTQTYGWQHLFVIRHSNDLNNHQLQLSSSYTMNDRLFFRKIASGSLEINNPSWIELATRGANNFSGNQNFLGNVGIGTTSPRAFFDMAQYISSEQIGTVFGRLPEGDTTESGTFLGVQGFATQGDDFGNVKSFSIIHNFYGQTNNSINFYRGGGKIGGFMTFCTSDNTEKMRIGINGYVGIGTKSPTSMLTVAGNIASREVKVTVDAGADFVFEKDYDLPSLESVDKFIEQNKHLPEIASAEEMKRDGINLSEMNIKLLQKIEEMTLYMIEMKKEIESLKNQNK